MKQNKNEIRLCTHKDGFLSFLNLLVDAHQIPGVKLEFS